MKFSAEQDAALKAVDHWLKKAQTPVFRLFGYAGAGKTTLARHIAENADGEVAFAAFTGKAAYVMRNKGCTDATTLHSLIYRPTGDEDEDDGPSFTIRRDAPASKADLIIIDECSMVDEDLGRDLLSFGNPVLVLGDPAQLPPVKGGGFFTEGEPDFMLTEIHRQAADNPIIRLSMNVREGYTDLKNQTEDFGEALQFLNKREIDAETILKCDQVLVGTNKTRRKFNDRIRELKGHTDVTPEVGEKLVCLRNNKKKGLLNGGLWDVTLKKTARGNKARMIVSPEEGGKSVSINVLHAYFSEGAENIPFAQRRNADEFDYGYALTVHKAQGSQWDHVVLFDESWAFREHSQRWLYTAITRAAEKLTIVR